MNRILIWDIPTRVFHWLLAVSFVGAYLTAETEKFRNLHLALGYTMLGLIVFRIFWGFAGTRYARFSSFRFGIGDVKTYLQSLLSSPKHYLGHNPAGALAIFALMSLAVLTPLVGIALYFEVGGYSLEELWEESHEMLGNAMLLVVLGHLAGVVVSSVIHKENLVGSMINGHKQGPAELGISRAYPLIGMILVLAVLGFWWVYLR
ncbi:MAG: cytochrome b/b6 domain-containing protein [Gammaproteobacteria bacterium]|nr:cytochrome b/b6 domain-containing protein [Gammaproteobacteria bacterium]